MCKYENLFSYFRLGSVKIILRLQNLFMLELCYIKILNIKNKIIKVIVFHYFNIK